MKVSPSLICRGLARHYKKGKAKKQGKQGKRGGSEWKSGTAREVQYQAQQASADEAMMDKYHQTLKMRRARLNMSPKASDFNT